MTLRRNRKLWKIRERRPAPSRMPTLEGEIAGETRGTAFLALCYLDEFKSIVCRWSGQLTQELLALERLAREYACETTRELAQTHLRPRNRFSPASQVNVAARLLARSF